MPRRKSKWEWRAKDDPEILPSSEMLYAEVTEQEIEWRLRGYLDCLRALAIDGPPDPKYIEWLCLKTGEPLISLTFLQKLRRRFGEAPE